MKKNSSNAVICETLSGNSRNPVASLNFTGRRKSS